MTKQKEHFTTKYLTDGLTEKVSVGRWRNNQSARSEQIRLRVVKSRRRNRVAKASRMLNRCRLA